MQLYKRIALVGAIANPNTGDEAILTSNLQLIQRMYGENCKIYVFTKDAAYTALYSSEPRMQIIPVDYLHQLSSGSNFDIERLINIRQELSNYIEKDYMQTATFCGQQGRISRTVRAILNGQPGISAGQRVLRPTDQY